MQVFVLILNHREQLEPLLERMVAEGITGATVLESRGMARVLGDEDTPMFGMLRSMARDSRAENRTVLAVMHDDQVETMRRLVNEVTGGISVPGAGIMFAVPVSFVEGLANEQ